MSHRLFRPVSAAITFVFLVLLSAPVFGANITYNVNVSGEGPISGHTLRVSGTITAETTSNTLLDEELTFFHENDPGVSLIFLDGLGEGIGWAWNATPQELRFERISSTNGFVRWQNSFDPPGQPYEEYSLRFGSGGNGHAMSYVLDDPNGVDWDQILLKPAGGPDSPGFLLGTAVPEPSSLCLLGLVSILLMTRLRHALSGKYGHRRKWTLETCVR